MCNMIGINYKNYMLILLTIIAAFNYIDRIILSLVLEQLKEELGLSDSQLGFLTGIAFTLFYAVAAIPIARWADRGNRNYIISGTVTLWSFMVAMCGLAASFTQLLLVRVGVAVGEAGCLPPAQSLIAHYFERKSRPKAMAIYWLCYPLAVLVGYFFGGWLVEVYGWRLTFILFGLVGIGLGVIAKLTLIEPRLEYGLSKENEVAPSFREVLAILWRRQAFRKIVIAFSFAYFFAMGIVQWLPTFYIRSHGMGLVDLGGWFAFSWGLCSLVGGYVGGVLTSRYLASNESLQMRIVASIYVVSGGLYLLLLLAPTKEISLATLALIGFVATLPNGAIFSVIQSLVDDRMRSMALAIVFFMANLIGFGLGPLAVGFLSDFLVHYFGGDSLKYAMAVFAPGYMCVAFFYWSASNSVSRDIDHAFGDSHQKYKLT